MRTKQESQRKRSGRFVGVAESSRAGRMAQASVKKLEHTGPTDKEKVDSVPQSEQSASTPEPHLPKGKKESHLCKSPSREEGESQGE